MSFHPRHLGIFPKNNDAGNSKFFMEFYVSFWVLDSI